MSDKSVDLNTVIHGEPRPCFDCGEQILDATLADGRRVTLNRDNTRHKFTCAKRSFQLRAERAAPRP